MVIDREGTTDQDQKEQEQKRLLYLEQREDVGKSGKAKQARGPKRQSLLDQESLIDRNDGQKRPEAKEQSEEEARKERELRAEERLEKSREILDKGKSKGGGRKKAIKNALSAIKEQGSAEVFQRASSFIQNSLWEAVISPGFILAIIGLDVYALLASGLLDAIISELSSKLASFGFFANALPKGLAKYLGITILLFLNIILVVLFIVIIVIIYYLIHPAELIKILPPWEVFKNLFSL